MTKSRRQRLCDLLVGFAARAPLEIVEPISRENEMRVRIDKSRQQNDAPFCIDDLRIARLLLDLVARTDDVDLAVANQHSAIANDRELRHFGADARPFRTSQRDKLRRVKKSDRLQDLPILLSTI